MDDADKLFFEGIGIADEDFLVEGDTQGKREKRAVGTDVDGEGVFRSVLVIGAAGDDEDGEAQEDALAAAAVGNGGVVRGGVGHGEMA
jgi:hypothetical protein